MKPKRALVTALTCLCLAAAAADDTGYAAEPADPGAGAASEIRGAGMPAGPPAGSAAISTKSLLQVIRDGGPLMIPIGLCSFVLCVFVFERFVSLRRGRIIPRPFVRRFLQQLRDDQLDMETALELCSKNRSPISEVFAAAVRKWSRPSVEIEQAIIDTGERVANRLRKHLRVLNGVATISPLLGLLGTVVGMIRAFNAIATADAMGRPELLAAGIGQALLTTAAGLSVAIPALIAYLFFVGRVDQLIMEIDALGQRVVDLIAEDGPGPQLLRVEQKGERKSRRKAG